MTRLKWCASLCVSVVFVVFAVVHLHTRHDVNHCTMTYSRPAAIHVNQADVFLSAERFRSNHSSLSSHPYFSSTNTWRRAFKKYSVKLHMDMSESRWLPLIKHLKVPIHNTHMDLFNSPPSLPLSALLSANAATHALRGTPVIYVHGNSGSWRQVRSFASEAANSTHPQFDFWSVDFCEEFGVMSGDVMRSQAIFLNEIIRVVLSLYQPTLAPMLHSENFASPKSVIIIGHSLGGIVSRYALTLPNYLPNAIHTIFTVSTPHIESPVPIHASIGELYREMSLFWGNDTNYAVGGVLSNVFVVSVSGGLRDILVSSETTRLTLPSPPPSPSPSSPSNERVINAISTNIPHVGIQIDHPAIVWCNEIVKKVSQMLMGVTRNGKDVLTLNDRFLSLSSLLIHSEIWSENNRKDILSLSPSPSPSLSSSSSSLAFATTYDVEMARKFLFFDLRKLEKYEGLTEIAMICEGESARLRMGNGEFPFEEKTFILLDHLDHKTLQSFVEVKSFWLRPPSSGASAHRVWKFSLADTRDFNSLLLHGSSRCHVSIPSGETFDVSFLEMLFHEIPLQNTHTQLSIRQFPPWISLSPSLSPPSSLSPRSTSPLSFLPSLHFLYSPSPNGESHSDYIHRRYFPNEGETLFLGADTPSLSLFSRPFESDDSFLDVLRFWMSGRRLEFTLKVMVFVPSDGYHLTFRVNFLETFFKCFLTSIKHIWAMIFAFSIIRGFRASLRLSSEGVYPGFWVAFVFSFFANYLYAYEHSLLEAARCGAFAGISCVFSVAFSNVWPFLFSCIGRLQTYCPRIPWILRVLLAFLSGILSYFVNGIFGVLLTFVAFLFTKSDNAKNDGLRMAYLAISFPNLLVLMTSLISIIQDLQVLGWRDILEMFFDVPLRSYNLDGCVCVLIFLLWYRREERERGKAREEREKEREKERERENERGHSVAILLWSSVYAYLLRCPFGVTHVTLAGYIIIAGILCGDFVLFSPK